MIATTVDDKIRLMITKFLLGAKISLFIFISKVG